ncbi:MAG: hypothetical protein HY814_11975 [Candidatus Riflebacteria bacterium]|nr:hypothetical protein [Candidatus Riflebacteria bacterium]
MSPWVIDAGPLIVWARADRLELLEKLLHEGVLVTPAVYREAVEDAGARPGAESLAKASWLQRVGAPESLPDLPAKLGQGESEVLSLAKKCGRNRSRQPREEQAKSQVWRPFHHEDPKRAKEARR